MPKMHRFSLFIGFFLFAISKVQAQKLPSLIPYEDNGLMGYCDTNCNVVISPKWIRADFFKNGKARTEYPPEGSEKIYCIINERGKYIIPPERHWNGEWNGWDKTIYNVHDDKGNRGIMDTNNHLLIPMKYQYSYGSNNLTLKNPWNKPVLVARMNDKVGVVDTFGNILMPFDYESIKFDTGANQFKSSIIAQKNTGTGIMDTNGQTVLPFEYETISFQDSFIIAAKNELWGILDKYGKERVPIKYDFIIFKDKVFKLFKTRLEDPAKENLQLPNTKISIDNGKLRIMKMQILDPSTLKPLTGLEVIDYDKYDNEIGLHFQKPDWCGYGRHMASMMQAFDQAYENGRPKITINGKPETDFGMDSMSWATQNYELPFTSQLPLKGRNKNGEFTAIIDQQMSYLVKPMPGPMKAITFNVRDSLIAVYEEGPREQFSYGLLDSHFKVVIPLQSKRIISGFRWKGKVYADVIDCNCPIDENRNFNPRDESIHFLLPERRTHNLMDDEGKVIDIGSGYTIIGMAGDDGNTSPDYDSHNILVSNEKGLKGIVNIDGAVLFPEISFKYKELTGKGDGIFYVRYCLTDSNHQEKCDYKYVNEHGKQLFPKIIINSIEPTAYPGLYYVEFWDKVVRHFYFRVKGKAYTSEKLD